MTASEETRQPLFRLVFRFAPEKKELILAALFTAGVTTIQEAELEVEDKGDTLICYFVSLTEAEDIENSVKDFISNLAEPFSFESDIGPLESLDWVNEWKKYVRPVSFGTKLIICPKDEVIDALPSQHVVRIDPQLAFGTGAHETTRLMLSAMVEVFETKKIESMLDVGCGSGILSIVARKFGVQTVFGLDNKQRAIDVSTENAKGNDVDIPFSVSPLAKHETQYELVVANIISSVIISLWGDLKRCVVPGGTLLISGILEEEKDDFLAQIDATPLSVAQDGEWLSFKFSF